MSGGPVALVGPTASGKSALAHGLARERSTLEVGCVDAMTVYRGMDIGTAKPRADERAEVRYHLCDLVAPSEEFTVAQFQAAAQVVARDVAARGGELLYVGGTGLYGRAVIDDLQIPGQFPAERAALEERAANDLPGLYGELAARDPVAAARTTATNRRRIVRALEVTLGSGRPFSSYGPGLDSYRAASVAQVGLDADPAELDRRVAVRFHTWMDEGLLDEVRTLAATPGGLSRTARQAVGYRELLSYLAGECSLAAAVSDAITATRQLARRQRKWFARDPRITWFTDPAAARDHLAQLLAATAPVQG